MSYLWQIPMKLRPQSFFATRGGQSLALVSYNQFPDLPKASLFLLYPLSSCAHAFMGIFCEWTQEEESQVGFQVVLRDSHASPESEQLGP